MNLRVILPWGYNLGEGVYSGLAYIIPGYSPVRGYTLGCYTCTTDQYIFCNIGHPDVISMLCYDHIPLDTVHTNTFLQAATIGLLP